MPARTAGVTPHWDFLCPYLEPFVDHYVFTDPRFSPDWIPAERSTTIWPSIDPFAPKNQDMTPRTVEAILTHVGLIAGRDGDTAFTRTDGSPGRVERILDDDDLRRRLGEGGAPARWRPTLATPISSVGSGSSKRARR
jgi:hypothetical protein